MIFYGLDTLQFKMVKEKTLVAHYFTWFLEWSVKDSFSLFK